MDEIYQELERFRYVYFEALKNDDPEASTLQAKISELERTIEKNLSSQKVEDVEKITKKLRENAGEAMKKIESIDNKTSIAKNVVHFVDDALSFTKSML